MADDRDVQSHYKDGVNYSSSLAAAEAHKRNTPNSPPAPQQSNETYSDYLNRVNNS